MSFLLVLAAALPSTLGYIYTYNNELLKLGHLEYRRVGLFTAVDAPAVGPPGDGESYIDVNVKMDRSTIASLGILQILVAHSSTFQHIGHIDAQEKRHFCCTQELLDVPGCSQLQLGKAVISSASDPPIQIQNVEWNQGEKTAQVNHRFEITKSGRYYLLFSSCLNSTGNAQMNGEIVWMNPYGYLPGELYYFIPLFHHLAVSYVVLSVFWTILCLVHRSHLLTIQHYISVFIFLGLLEALAWYWDYLNFNKVGLRAIGPVIAGVLLSSVKRTLSRILVLIVCMGYGIMNDTLRPDQRNKVVVLGVVYFMFSSIYDVMSSYSQMTFIMQHIRAFFLFPVAALDSLFFMWILQELSNNMQILTDRKQAAKLSVYRRFWNILLTTAVFSVVWALYQVVVTFSSPEDERWETLWTFEGMWHVIYLFVLVSIAFLWRPSQHAHAYAYSDQISAMDDDDVRDRGVALQPAFTIAGGDDEDDEDY